MQEIGIPGAVVACDSAVEKEIPGCDAEALVPLANELATESRRVELLGEAVRDILGRLEL